MKETLTTLHLALQPVGKLTRCLSAGFRAGFLTSEEAGEYQQTLLSVLEHCQSQERIIKKQTSQLEQLKAELAAKSQTDLFN